MNVRWKIIALVAAIWSLLASASNILGLWLLDPARIPFWLGLSGFLFSLVGHIFWLVSALMYASKSALKRWPLWFFLLHPLFSVIAFWVVNRQQITSTRPNQSFNPDAASTGSSLPPTS